MPPLKQLITQALQDCNKTEADVTEVLVSAEPTTTSNYFAARTAQLLAVQQKDQSLILLVEALLFDLEPKFIAERNAGLEDRVSSSYNEQMLR